MDVNKYFIKYSEKIEELGFKSVSGTNFPINPGLKVSAELFREIHHVTAEALRKSEMFLSFYKIDAMRNTYFWEDHLLFLNVVILKITDIREIKISIPDELRIDFLENLTRIVVMSLRKNDILKSRASEALLNYIATFYSKEIIDQLHKFSAKEPRETSKQLSQIAQKALFYHLKSLVFPN